MGMIGIAGVVGVGGVEARLRYPLIAFRRVQGRCVKESGSMSPRLLRL